MKLAFHFGSVTLVRMSVYATVLLACGLHCLAAAELSKPTNGVYVAIAGYSKLPEVAWNERLVFLTFCDNERVELTYPNNVYGLRIKMIDSNGKEVPKTSLGKRVGAKYDLLGKQDFQQVVKEVGIWNLAAVGSFRDNPDLGGGQFLPQPNEMFEMTNPGVYTLELQMQMYRLKKSNWTRTVFQFSPVTLKVAKPADK